MSEVSVGEKVAGAPAWKRTLALCLLTAVVALAVGFATGWACARLREPEVVLPREIPLPTEPPLPTVVNEELGWFTGLNDPLGLAARGELPAAAVQ
jgi:hypothetical protein